MFNGLFHHSIWMTALAGISVILAAVYTLSMVQKVIYGDGGAATDSATEISGNRQWALVLIALLILALGVYPQPLIELTKDTVQAIIVNR